MTVKPHNSACCCYSSNPAKATHPPEYIRRRTCLRLTTLRKRIIRRFRIGAHKVTAPSPRRRRVFPIERLQKLCVGLGRIFLFLLPLGLCSLLLFLSSRLADDTRCVLRQLGIVQVLGLVHIGKLLVSLLDHNKEKLCASHWEGGFFLVIVIEELSKPGLCFVHYDRR